MRLASPVTEFFFGPRTRACEWARGAMVILGVAMLGWGCGPALDDAAPPAPLPQSTGTRLESKPLVLQSPSDRGHYLISARPATSPLPLHRMHDWIVAIELAGDGSQIPTAIHFDGGMPAHGHGFVTQPRVTRNLGGGEFLVEGVKFHMPGDWVIQVSVTSRDSSDQVTLPLVIEP